MLCGEVAQSGRAAGRPLSLPLSLAAACAEGTRSPYSALLQALAASADDDDADADADAAMEHLMGRDAATGTPTDNIFLENGLLSYENPNYRGLDACRLDDALNSNSDDLYAELLLLSRGAAPASKTAAPTSTTGRRGYATLDVGSMGVDVVAGPQTDTEPLADNRQHREDSEVAGLDNLFNDNVNLVARAMGRMRTQPDLIECSAELRSLKSCATEDEGSRDEEEGKGQEGGSPPGSPSPPDSPDEGGEATLPAGWERHEDNDGPYFWHIKSGTIQREAPTRAQPDVRGRAVAPPAPGAAPTVVRSQTSWELDGRSAGSEARRPRSFPEKPPPAQTLPASSGAVRFAVRSLGWVEISELDLTPERSSRAVNKCIVDLSLGRHDLLDVVGRWGDGKELFMDLDDGALKLVDPDNLAGLNTQPIHTIRVWGVGRDNGRDFAYVARDRATRRHMCHVFRCDIPARTIANTLRDICKRIMIERSLAHAQDSRAARPTDLPTQTRRLHRTQPPAQPLAQGQSFPTPMEEPRKVLRAQYLGSTQVSRATGVDTLNDAIALLVATLPTDRWLPVNVAVAPSMISILRPEDGTLVAECRVRYLSFLGIGRDVKQCGFIVHTAQDLFVAHVFHCEPSSGALCKTVEAACKLRYQKCLDAHPQGAGGRGAAGGGATTPGRGLGATLKSLVGTFTGRRLRASQS